MGLTSYVHCPSFLRCPRGQSESLVVAGGENTSECEPTPMPPICRDYRNVHIVAWCHFIFVVLGIKPRALCMLGQVFYH